MFHDDMASDLCSGASSPFHFADPCIRESWAAILPAAIVLLLCISHLPVAIPVYVQNVLGVNTFRRFLTLHEAEALNAASEDAVDVEIVVNAKSPLWRTLLLCGIALLQSMAWLALASYRLITEPFHASLVLPYVLALPWLYATLRPLLKPLSTPPYDLFVLLLVHLFMGILMLGGALYTHYVLGGSLARPLVLAGLSVNIAAVLVNLVVVINIPMGAPSSRVKEADIVSLISTDVYAVFLFTPSYARRESRFRPRTTQLSSNG